MKAQRWIPLPYQDRARRWLLRHDQGALLLDPGLGKTSVTLSVFKAQQKSGKARRMLVVAPLRPCYLVWSSEGGGELAKWSNFRDLRVSLLHGKHKAERLTEDSDLYVINYAGLKWLIESGGLRQLIGQGANTLCFDELSKLKKSNTKRFKMMKAHFGRFPLRRGLTGSPAPNGLIDLFGQIYAMDLGASLGRYVTHYRHKYFFPSGYGGYEWKLQPGADKKIHKAIKGVALSMRATDHLDLPPLVERELWVDLPKAARKTYDELEKELLAEVGGETITAANAAVASGKCRQVASGGLYHEVPAKDLSSAPLRETLVVHDEKAQALKDLIDELQGTPLLVGYEFQHDVDRIRDVLGKNTPAIGGGLSLKKTTVIVAKWNAGEIPVLLGHPAAMGHGLNMQFSGAHLCWFTPTWDLELYDQFNRRVWRQGVKSNRVIVHRILARDTVDVAVAKALAEKKRTQGALMQALRGYLKKRKESER